MNGNSTGAIPTYDITGNNNGWGGGIGEWILGLVALGMLGNGGLFGGWGGNGYGGMMYEFPWLLNGQQGINNNTNNGFDNLHLSNQIEGARDSINNLSTQLCGSTADIVSAVSNGFYNSEIAAANRQMADMNQNFNNQIATLNGFNNLNNALSNCCCENRLGIANLNSTILAENCADRAALADGLKDVLINQTANTQKILDQLCQDKIDSKNETISQLRQELLYARGQASQVAQTADIRANNATVANQLVSELRSCPIPSMPVYGNQAIFSCNGGCGCSSNIM